MTVKEKIESVIDWIITALTDIFYVLALVIAFGVLYQTCSMEFDNWWRIWDHRYMAAGFALFFVTLFIPRIRQNVKWFMTFAHEFIHTIFAMLFLRKINRFVVDDKNSHISYSSGFASIGYRHINLMPYCFPFFTWIMIPWRWSTSSKATLFLHMIDLLMGFSLAFHVCCWAKQTRLSQSDITGPGKVRSMIFILFYWILTLCMFLQTSTSGIDWTFSRVFWGYPKDFINSVIALCQNLF
ncbi:MAG: hypothetical protein MJY67_05365 [Bacteroidales bacterium]|nr:hypothetical protein [Bacteroidales bacterium]